MSDAPASETTTIHALDISVEERRVRSFDGTDIAYHTVGQGPPVLLANGLGGSWKAWSHQIRHFRSRHRFISWDQRGLFRSGAPADPAALDISGQARDAVAVLDAAGIGKCLVFGWSMGVQTTLELWRRAPERIAGIVLINGVAGSPWTTLPDLPKATVTAPRVLRGLRRVLTAGRRVLRRRAPGCRHRFAPPGGAGGPRHAPRGARGRGPGAAAARPEGAGGVPRVR